MSRRTILAGACTALAAGALTVGLTTTAFASPSGGGGNPQPTPTYTTKPPIQCPPGTVLVGDKCVPVVVQPVLQQQEFDLLENNILPNGWVLGTGPINIVGGVDVTTSNPRVDFFDSANKADGVRINHEPLAGSVIDRRTCSIEVNQYDLPWSIHFGFGRFTGATGNGVYDLAALFSFPTVRNHCTLPYGLSSGQADWDLNNGSGLPTPLAYSVSVQAVGRAAVPRQVPPNPCPTPTRSVFAPVNGQPTWTPPPTCQPDPTRSVYAPVSG